MRIVLVLASLLALTGCGAMTTLRRTPLASEDFSRRVAASDARIEARVEAIVVRNGPGSWAHQASWDEYRIRVRNDSGAPIRVTGVAVRDMLGFSAAPQRELSDLRQATRRALLRYRDHGLTVAGGSNAGASMPLPLGLLPPPALFAGVGGVMLGAGSYYAVQALHDQAVNAQIQRRHTALPATIGNAQELGVTLFFPICASPASVELVYADARGEHRLDIETATALSGLHLPPGSTK